MIWLLGLLFSFCQNLTPKIIIQKPRIKVTVSIKTTSKTSTIESRPIVSAQVNHANFQNPQSSGITRGPHVDEHNFNLSPDKKIIKMITSVEACPNVSCVEDFSSNIYSNKIMGDPFDVVFVKDSVKVIFSISNFPVNSQLTVADLKNSDVHIYGIIYCKLKNGKNETINATVSYSVSNTTMKGHLCVYFDMVSEQWSTLGCSGSSKNGVFVCTCNHLSVFAILVNPNVEKRLSPTQKYQLSMISKIGLLLSAAFEYLAMGLIFLFWKNSKKSITQMYFLQLCFCLYMLNFSFLGITSGIDDLSCKISGCFLHYFLLASFFWMCANAFYHYMILVKVIGLNFTILKILTPLATWILPAVIVLISYEVSDNLYHIKDNICWIRGTSLYLSVYLPIIIVIVINIYIFIKILLTFEGNIPLPRKKRMKTLFLLFMSFGTP